MTNPFQILLRSNLAWRLSGLSYPTGVFATRGHLQSVQRYLTESRGQMLQVRRLMSAESRVLEFGCGLGGNISATHDWYARALGVDINPGFVRIARGIARRIGAENVDFQVIQSLEDLHLDTSFDLIFTIGVFERLSEEAVIQVLSRLREILSDSGVIAAYFLSDRARSVEFSRRLGKSAYTYWSYTKVASACLIARLRVAESGVWLSSSIRTIGNQGVGDLYLLKL